MPIELGIWRIDQTLQRINFSPLDIEARLEDILDQEIAIAAPNWMVIGRQVQTAYGKFIDLLAMDADGNLIVLELKRARTPRDIVAQVLDYGSWVRGLEFTDLAPIYERYVEKYKPHSPATLEEAFAKRFGMTMPDDVNDAHELVIVASHLDPTTERVVQYLAEEHTVKINAIFFQVFKDGDREYLSRVWLHDPEVVDEPSGERAGKKGAWNGEFYGSFGVGEKRDWDEAQRYGFFSGGGGRWYSRTLDLLEPDARIWVNVPGDGYVGVARVLEAAVPVEEFLVKDDQGRQVPIVDLPLKAANLPKASDDPEAAEYLVRVEWLKTKPLEQAIKEKGFFGNQNTVARPRTDKWDFTVERLKKRFQVAD